MTILVADDGPAELRLAMRVLKSAGFKVLTAKDGGELVKLWQKARGRSPVVLSDIHMPGDLDGIQACEKIREMDPGARVFLMSGDLDRCAEAEAKGFTVALRKPYEVRQLREWSAGLK